MCCRFETTDTVLIYFWQSAQRCADTSVVTYSAGSSSRHWQDTVVSVVSDSWSTLKHDWKMIVKDATVVSLRELQNLGRVGGVGGKELDAMVSGSKTFRMGFKLGHDVHKSNG